MKYRHIIMSIAPEKVGQELRSHFALGRVAGIAFFEHPFRGDEAPLCVLLPDDETFYYSNFYEVPSAEELGLELGLA